MIVDYVDAKFGGKDIRFRLGPKALEWFERLHGSARATLHRFLGNNWTIYDLKAVLGASHPTRLLSGSEIDATLAANKPANYVPLATTILVAGLSGIDPESAVFSDEESADDD